MLVWLIPPTRCTWANISHTWLNTNGSCYALMSISFTPPCMAGQIIRSVMHGCALLPEHVGIPGVAYYCSNLWWHFRKLISQSWWRHQMEKFFALLAICTGNSSVTGEFPAQRPVTRSFDVFFDLHLNKRLSKQWWGWWFETPSRPLWPYCNDDSTVFKSKLCHYWLESLQHIALA